MKCSVKILKALVAILPKDYRDFLNHIYFDADAAAQTFGEFGTVGGTADLQCAFFHFVFSGIGLNDYCSDRSR